MFPASVLVSGLDLTVCESLFKAAAQRDEIMVVLDFNSGRTFMRKYLESSRRNVSTELPRSGFSSKAVADAYFRIVQNEMQYHLLKAALSLLEEVSLALDNTGLTLDRYLLLAEPDGFNNAMETLEHSGMNADLFRARYARYAEKLNDADAVLEMSSLSEFSTDTVYYLTPAKAFDTVENRTLINRVNAALTSCCAPVTFVINEGLVNHADDITELVRNCTDAANICCMYFTANTFASPSAEALISCFERVVFTRHDIAAAIKISEYFGTHEIREQKTSITQDKRLHAYSLPDKLFKRDRTITTSTEVRTVPFFEAERIARLPTGSCITLDRNTGHIMTTSTERLLL